MKPKNKAKAPFGASGVFSAGFCLVKQDAIKTTNNLSGSETHTRQLFYMKMATNHQSETGKPYLRQTCVISSPQASPMGKRSLRRLLKGRAGRAWSQTTGGHCAKKRNVYRSGFHSLTHSLTHPPYNKCICILCICNKNQISQKLFDLGPKS